MVNFKQIVNSQDFAIDLVLEVTLESGVALYSIQDFKSMHGIDILPIVKRNMLREALIEMEKEMEILNNEIGE